MSDLNLEAGLKHVPAPSLLAGRRGRPFTLRLEPEAEQVLTDRLRAYLARQDSLPWDSKEREPYGQRTHSLGAFIVKMAVKGSATPSSSAGKTARAARPRPRGKTKRRPTSAKAAGRKLRALNARYGKNIRKPAKKKAGRK